MDCKQNSGGAGLPIKVKEVIKSMKIPYQGPVWHLIIKAAMSMVNKAL